MFFSVGPFSVSVCVMLSVSLSVGGIRVFSALSAIMRKSFANHRNACGEGFSLG